jgi:hypothetical protein
MMIVLGQEESMARITEAANGAADA